MLSLPLSSEMVDLQRQLVLLELRDFPRHAGLCEGDVFCLEIGHRHSARIGSGDEHLKLILLGVHLERRRNCQTRLPRRAPIPTIQEASGDAN